MRACLGTCSCEGTTCVCPAAVCSATDGPRAGRSAWLLPQEAALPAVSFSAESLHEGQAAEALLAKFAPALRGRHAVVVKGPMSVEGLPLQHHGP